MKCAHTATKPWRCSPKSPDMVEFRPLQITATVPFGISCGTPWAIALDGLLASVLWHRHKATADPPPYDPRSPADDLDLPLARCELGDLWHWAATFCSVPTPLPDPDVRTRRRTTDHRALLRNSAVVSTNVDDVRGRYRARSSPSMAIVANSAIWRAVGDADAIGDLLNDLTAIGKHRDSGEGLVTVWTITELDADPWSAAHEHHPGVLGRTTPLACLEDHTTVHTGIAMVGVRAPYIHPSRHTRAYLPVNAAHLWN